MPLSLTVHNEQRHTFCSMTTTMMGIIEDEVAKETPPLALPLFPTDALLHILSFVYHCKNCPGGPAGSNIVALIRSHNDLHCLYTTWPLLRPILRAFAQQEESFFFSSVATAAPPSCPFAHCLKIIQHTDVQSYQCSGDTPRHKIHNLLRQHKDDKDEEHDWNNTWYDPTLRLDLNPYYAQLWLRQPVKLLAYGITNAHGAAGCDPKNWRLLVTRRTGPEIGLHCPYQKFTVAHAVQNYQFQQRHETFWHVLLDPPKIVDSLVTTIRLAIDETWVENQGTQIAQLYLVVVEESD